MARGLLGMGGGSDKYNCGTSRRHIMMTWYRNKTENKTKNIKTPSAPQIKFSTQGSGNSLSWCTSVLSL